MSLLSECIDKIKIKWQPGVVSAEVKICISPALPLIWGPVAPLIYPLYQNFVINFMKESVGRISNDWDR